MLHSTLKLSVLLWCLILVLAYKPVEAVKPPISDATQECISCHSSVTPAIVLDWKKSRHAEVTPSEALGKELLQRRVSSDTVVEKLARYVVGCAECHAMNLETHKDVFNHNDVKVHLTVTPHDCQVCHTIEAGQYKHNLMSHAHGNLVKNELYRTLMKSINGVQSLEGMKTRIAEPDDKTTDESCLSCHGTELEVKGKYSRDTDFGEMEFPLLSGWPNEGVGRLNPDGSQGSCSACHGRHQFSLAVARKSYACAQCHKGPDVPAYKVYSVSKHGSLFSALGGKWNWVGVPWTVGKDFDAPTCAVCHVSLLVNAQGEMIIRRSHQMNDRLPWRIFGLIYAHPHPKSPDTTLIKNEQGLPLPTNLNGTPTIEYLIGTEEMALRKATLQKVCLACHTQDWVQGHWDRFENTINTSDQMVLTATRIVEKAWDMNVADKKNMFDEAIEKQWVAQWLFYGNSTRFSSAMMGADYGVFADGRWYLGKTVQDMLNTLESLLAIKARKQ